MSRGGRHGVEFWRWIDVGTELVEQQELDIVGDPNVERCGDRLTFEWCKGSTGIDAD